MEYSRSWISIWTSGEGVGSLRYFTNPRAFPFKENPSHMVSGQTQKTKTKDKDLEKDKDEDKMFTELFRSRRTLLTWSSPFDERNWLNLLRVLV